MAGVTALEEADSGPVPMPFRAATRNVYGVPFPSPPIVAAATGPTVTAACAAAPTYAVTTYAVTALPPLEAGLAQVTVACALPPVAATASGGPGSVAGVTAFDKPDSGPAPITLTAATEKV